jgi:muramidase (phage lysozyme)
LSGELGLIDFSPETQDRMALQLVFERGALPSIMAGNIENAFTLCRREWASLPGSGFHQHENLMRDLVDAYNEARAKYAAH